MECPDDMKPFFPKEWLCSDGSPQFYVPDGWEALITNLHKKIIAVQPVYELHQVKEKFGGLRYYTGGGFDALVNSDIREWIDEAEFKSYRLCVECGKEGKSAVVNKRYVTTVCEEHLPEGGVFRETD